MEVDDFAHAGVLVEFIGSLILTLDSEANFWVTASFKNAECVLEEHASEANAAVVSTNSELAHPAEVRIFVTKHTADKFIFCF